MKATEQGEFDRVVLPHMDAAFNLARWLCGNSHDAEDVTQEAMLRAYRFFDSLRGGEPRSWLFKIVRNTYYTSWRRAKARGDAAEFDEEAHSDADSRAGDPETIVSLSQQAGRADAAIAGLPVEYREAIVLRELEDLSYREIADMLEVPMGTVMSRISRARRMIVEWLAKDEITGARRGSSRVRSA